jgi:hypothetical protein
MTASVLALESALDLVHFNFLGVQFLFKRLPEGNVALGHSFLGFINIFQRDFSGGLGAFSFTNALENL